MVSSLMARLGQYAASSPEMLEQVRSAAAFSRFMDTCAKVGIAVELGLALARCYTFSHDLLAWGIMRHLL